MSEKLESRLKDAVRLNGFIEYTSYRESHEVIELKFLDTRQENSLYLLSFDKDEKQLLLHGRDMAIPGEDIRKSIQNYFNLPEPVHNSGSRQYYWQEITVESLLP